MIERLTDENRAFLNEQLRTAAVERGPTDPGTLGIWITLQQDQIAGLIEAVGGLIAVAEGHQDSAEETTKAVGRIMDGLGYLPCAPELSALRMVGQRPSSDATVQPATHPQHRPAG